MTDRNKFEEMLERLINEDREGAEELFHEIVVEKSREIYQSIIESEEEDDDNEVEESSEEEVDESDDELDESSDDEDDDDLDEMFNLDEFEVEADPMSLIGGDATDDMINDIGMDDAGMDDNGMDDAGMDDEGDEDINNRVMDLEDALAELQSEFEAMMGGNDDEEEEEEEDEEEEEEEEPEKESFAPAFEAKNGDKKDDKKSKKSSAEEMREYVEKISPAKMGDNGLNTKSIVASKNDMGGTASNILQSKSEKGVEANKGKLQGSALNNQTPKVNNAGNINVPGGKAGKAMSTAKAPAKGENAANSKSTLGSK